MPDTQTDVHKKLLGKQGEKLAEQYLKKQGYKLRMDSFIRAEISSEEAADEVSIHWSIISWEMNVFKRAE